MFVFISVWCHYVWRPRALVVRRLSKSTDLIWFDLKLPLYRLQLLTHTHTHIEREKEREMRRAPVKRRRCNESATSSSLARAVTCQRDRPWQYSDISNLAVYKSLVIVQQVRVAVATKNDRAFNHTVWSRDTGCHSNGHLPWPACTHGHILTLLQR